VSDVKKVNIYIQNHSPNCCFVGVSASSLILREEQRLSVFENKVLT